VTRALSRTVIRGLEGTPALGWWRVECLPERGGCGWWIGSDTFADSWHLERQHQCPQPVGAVRTWPEHAGPPAGYLGPSWDDLLPAPPAPPKPRGRVLVGAARALVGTVSGRPQ
jgi:hypothetical protein